MLLHFYISTCAYNHLQPPLQFPSKMRFSASVNFELVILFLLVQKFMLTIPLTFPSSIAQQCFTSLVLRTTIPKIYTKNVFSAPAIWPIQAVSGVQWAREFYDIWNYLISPFFLKVWSVIAGAHNYWFLIAQAKKIGVLQVVVSDEDACKRNGKPFNPPSLIPSTSCHYFHTLLIPSQQLTSP